MIEKINETLRILGGGVVVIFIYTLIFVAINKFNRWRKNGCKIKCLCKPHKYELIWYWRNTEEAVLECKKCGKRKQVFIDYDSIKKKIH